MAEAVDYSLIIKRIEKIERDLEELKLELLRKQIESQPAEEIDDELYEELLRKAEKLEKGEEAVSGEEAIKLLKQTLEE
ncbi:hypothetical protein [Thermococcus barophilus]|uniref:hypothetical protein n=1 Tax=Thermococcus barophilus TaxID=55802 RepID=UPI000704895F|nr:hypothetical protein [Thermococcus barophilus]